MVLFVLLLLVALLVVVVVLVVLLVTLLLAVLLLMVLSLTSATAVDALSFWLVDGVGLGMISADTGVGNSDTAALGEVVDVGTGATADEGDGSN
jgi:hypothetical protein